MGWSGVSVLVFVDAVGLSTIVGVSRHVVRRCGSELRDSRTRELVGSVSESVDEDTGIVVRSRDTGGVELGISVSMILCRMRYPAASEGSGELEGMSLPIELILFDPGPLRFIDFGNLEQMVPALWGQFMRSLAVQSISVWLPGLAGATNEAGFAPGPQVIALFIAPLTGLASVI